jgi:hypothetical protein
MCLQVIIFTIEGDSVQSDGHPSVIVLAVCHSGSELDSMLGSCTVTKYVVAASISYRVNGFSYRYVAQHILDPTTWRF